MPSLYLECACGNAISVSRWRSGKRICTSCGIAKGIDHNRQMHTKTGEEFNSWKRAMQAIVNADSITEEGKDDGRSR